MNNPQLDEYGAPIPAKAAPPPSSPAKAPALAREAPVVIPGPPVCLAPDCASEASQLRFGLCIEHNKAFALSVWFGRWVNGPCALATALGYWARAVQRDSQANAAKESTP